MTALVWICLLVLIGAGLVVLFLLEPTPGELGRIAVWGTVGYLLGWLTR